MSVNVSTQSRRSPRTQTKHCTKCGANKPLTEFNKRKESSDGHAPRCRPCVKIQRQSWRQETDYTGPESSLTPEQRGQMYMDVIDRMHQQGLICEATKKSYMARVEDGIA